MTTTTKLINKMVLEALKSGLLDTSPMLSNAKLLYKNALIEYYRANQDIGDYWDIKSDAYGDVLMAVFSLNQTDLNLIAAEAKEFVQNEKMHK